MYIYPLSVLLSIHGPLRILSLYLVSEASANFGRFTRWQEKKEKKDWDDFPPDQLGWRLQLSKFPETYMPSATSGLANCQHALSLVL